MDLLTLANAADDVSAMEPVSEVGSPEEGFEIVAGDSLDFDSWTSLISEIEKTYSDNIKAISSVYELFLSWFPLCHKYWKKYADHMTRLCTVEKAVEIFEQAVQSATYSVGLWVDYCSFSVLAFADPSDVRRIFERGLSFVGKDFLCHRLWDLYIRFELSQQRWSFLAHILIRTLKFPTKSLHKYYDNFKEFAAFVEEDMSFSKSGNLEPHAADSDIELATSNDEIYHAIKELQDSSSVDQRSKALNELITIGERFYRKSCKLHDKIDYFENYMDRDFFDVKPLDDEELQNWHNYLDFIEKQVDFDWAVKLYERCLIPCANYPEFWMRYVEFMESKGGRELANIALERATQVFLKNVSKVHIFNARFREKIGDIEGARAAFHLCDTESDSSFIETALNEANMETRLGNMDTALEIYDKALKMAVEKEKINIIPTLYTHFFRLKFLITGSADAAMDLLLAGIQQVPFSKLLLEEFINFAMMHEGSKYLDVVDHITAVAITCESDGSQGLSSKDREDLSNLYLKFVDYCGTTHDIRKAWNRHIKSFPHLIRSTSSSHNHNRLSNEPRETIPHLVAKQPSRVHRIKHIKRKNEKHKLLISKNQATKPHKATTNTFGEKDDNNSVMENTHSQQSEDNSAGELDRLKLQSRNQVQNELPVSQKDDQDHEDEDETCIKPISLEKEHNESANKENEDTMSPSTANQNPILASESAKKQNESDVHEPETDKQQIPSQDVETCKTNLMLTASENVTQLPNVQPQNPKSSSEVHLLPQNPSSASELQLSPQNVQPMVQFPVQSGEQSGVMQNPQAYNQMSQYQYQHQHQNQQQWLQMQQSYQQMYIQQQQQIQPQQYQYYQQMEQYQQYWSQVYQQQQQQQLQQYNMQMQQYQQMQQQGQGTMPPNTAMPYTQPNPNMVVQPTAAPMSSNIVSPGNHQQPTDTKSLNSPSID